MPDSKSRIGIILVVSPMKFAALADVTTMQVRVLTSVVATVIRSSYSTIS